MYISITVEVPFLNRSFDFKIPKSMNVSGVIKLICEIIQDRHCGLALDFEGAELLSVSLGKLLDKDSSVEKNRLVNNSKLILI